ncbi:MAG TPA: Gfo/Idh/MocA family oxidoreductase, partial [Methylomirabilota bacterium]|nr:Gfo/Idh/MocA family oxidoreductase [Methylomirabilota bacterium]
MGGERRTRAGVVGVGHMGQYHALVYAELWDVDLVGVVDIDAERAAAVARHYDTRVLADHRDLIGEVDVVSVAVPTEQHFHVARDLLEAGVGVLVEKPIAPTLEEARELFAIARRSGAALQVGHVERFNGAVQELRSIVQRPILVESRRLGPFVPRVQKDTVVMDLMIHDLDIVLALV